MVPGAVRQIRREAWRFAAGMAALVVLGLTAYLVATAGRGFPLTVRTTVQAAFTNVDALQTGDEVREHSKRIGQVGDITLENNRAVVTLELEGNRSVYADATAAVWDFSALGAKFVEFRPGTPAAGPLNGRIEGVRTVPSSDIHEVLNVFDDPTRENARHLIREVGGGLAGGSGDLRDFFAGSPDLLSDLGQVSATLASPSADLPVLLEKADELSRRFDGRHAQIASLLDQTAATFEALTVAQAAPLRESLRRLPRTLDTAKTAFDALDQPLADTEAAMVALRSGAAGLGRATDDLRGFLRDSPPPLGRVPAVSDAAQPAVEELDATFGDARPLAPPLVDALADLAPPLAVLAPYAGEAGQLFVRGDSFVAEGTALPGVHYARLTVAPNLASVTDGIARTPRGIKPRNAYPAPGQADRDRAGLGVKRPNLGGGK